MWKKKKQKCLLFVIERIYWYISSFWSTVNCLGFAILIIFQFCSCWNWVCEVKNMRWILWKLGKTVVYLNLLSLHFMELRFGCCCVVVSVICTFGFSLSSIIFSWCHQSDIFHSSLFVFSSLAIFIAVDLCLSLALSISFDLYLSLSFSVYLCLSLYISVDIYLSLSTSVYLFLSLSIFL